ncbi:MAG TPA: chromate transporter [Methylomirabilota bacterium]|jgi:chromate transporter|nr:chromate transporter [Methylomirabilota bacterium]
MIHAELFARFVLVSLLAFGGGQAALPMVERLAVHDTHWITASAFGAAVAFAYLTPGPVLIVATFVGYHVAGVSGALAATLGAFLAPCTLAALVARQAARFTQRPWFRRFGTGAAPAVMGLLGVTTLAIARDAVGTSWAHLGIVALVAGLSAGTRLHPAVLLILGGCLGYLSGSR